MEALISAVRKHKPIRFTDLAINVYNVFVFVDKYDGYIGERGKGHLCLVESEMIRTIKVFNGSKSVKVTIEEV